MSDSQERSVWCRRGRFALILVAVLAPASGLAQQITDHPGLGVDVKGNPVVDPTKNVLDVIASLKEMLGKLRDADKELLDARLKAERDLNELRSRYDKELLSAATAQLKAEAVLRAEFQEKYALTEKGRVDAIRLVDKNAVDVATAGSVATASALAKTVQDTAENSRKLVETTALETNRNIQQQFAAVTALLVPIGTRLTALEQAAAEGSGRQKYQDPVAAAALAKLEKLADVIATGAGKSEGISSTLAALLAVGGLLLGAITFGVPLLLRAAPARSSSKP